MIETTQAVIGSIAAGLLLTGTIGLVWWLPRHTRRIEAEDRREGYADGIAGKTQPARSDAYSEAWREGWAEFISLRRRMPR